MQARDRRSLLGRAELTVGDGDHSLDAKRRRGEREGGDWQVVDEAVEAVASRRLARLAGVEGRGRLVAERLVRSLVVVEAKVVPDASARLGDAVIGVQVDLLVL